MIRSGVIAAVSGLALAACSSDYCNVFVSSAGTSCYLGDVLPATAFSKSACERQLAGGACSGYDQAVLQTWADCIAAQPACGTGSAANEGNWVASIRSCESGAYFPFISDDDATGGGVSYSDVDGGVLETLLPADATTLLTSGISAACLTALTQP